MPIAAESFLAMIAPITTATTVIRNAFICFDFEV